MPEASVNDIRIAYEQHGPEDATPLVLVQGLSMPLNAWPPALLDRLVNEGFHVVTLDNRDIGKSESFQEFGVPNVPWQIVRMRLGLSVRSAYRLHDMARDIVGLMDTLGIDSAHVAGVSMGGMISQELAMGHSGRVRSLTSIMSTTGNPRLPRPDREIFRLMMSRPKTEDVDARIAHSMKLWRLISSPGFEVDFDYVEQRLSRPASTPRRQSRVRDWRLSTAWVTTCRRAFWTVSRASSASTRVLPSANRPRPEQPRVTCATQLVTIVPGG